MDALRNFKKNSLLAVAILFLLTFFNLMCCYDASITSRDIQPIFARKTEKLNQKKSGIWAPNL
jgi:hypothetical protein